MYAYVHLVTSTTLSDLLKVGLTCKKIKVKEITRGVHVVCSNTVKLLKHNKYKSILYNKSVANPARASQGKKSFIALFRQFIS